MNHHDEEILILDLFRKNYPDFPKGKLMKSESPDFILKIAPKKSIGIEITRLHDGNRPKNNPGFPVAELTMPNIEGTISNKEDKLILYKQKNISIFWLIITTDYLRVPVSINNLDFISNWKISTGYHKVFLFDLFEKKIFELNTK
jgi:ATP adenylyltransferase/5',5'''-P-1,P-4-tetraphosphate phosphorylase II